MKEEIPPLKNQLGAKQLVVLPLSVNSPLAVASAFLIV